MLERTTLNNVDDAAGGWWQYEGGTVFEEKRQVGYSAADNQAGDFRGDGRPKHRDADARSVLHPQMPPQNIVVQGTHDFNSGGEIGSVSAASTAFATYLGKEFHRTGSVLTIA